MKTLVAMALSDGIREVSLPSGRSVGIRSLSVHFAASPHGKLPPATLKSTYTSKPMVMAGSEPVFGEIAIVRALEADGWSAVWVDTFHGHKFWKSMPHKGSPSLLSGAAKQRYDAIVLENGKPSGLFDVMAWKDGRVIHLEYKGAGDRPNKNESAWIEAALRAGVSIDDLFSLFIEHEYEKQ